jgi:hypothetical protein
MFRLFSIPIFVLELLLIIFLLFSFSWPKQDMCGISIVKSYNQEIFGKNVGFFVVFKNNSERSMDAIEYTVTYKNGFDETKGKRSFSWQAGNFFGPKLPGESLKDGSTTWIDDANKISIVIKRVHFTDGTKCK